MREEDLLPLVSEEGLVSFLSSSWIKGIGKTFAQRIAKKVGRAILNKEFDFDKDLKEVPGLGESKINELKQSLLELKYNPLALAVLFSAKIGGADVEKIAGHYGRKLDQVIFTEPYDMVENVWKVSFFTADKLGRLLGVPQDDPGRIRGALLTAVKFYAERGSMFATEEEAVKTASSLTGVEEEKVREQIRILVDEEKLINSLDGLYLPPYYIAEQGAAEKLKDIIRNFREDELIFDIPTTDLSGNPLNKGQIDAIRTVMANPVTVITGGPGTGKTTALRGIIRMYEDMDKKVVLAAPTGRAAKRMSDLAGMEAKTIHRLLGYSMGRGYRNKKFDADLLVIDEASMLEQVLFNHLLDAVGTDTRIVLVGDTQQLPSIGAGDVLNQMIESGAVPVVRLSENFRQKEGSMISANAEDIRLGQPPRSEAADDFMLLTEEGEPELKERVLRLLSEEIPSLCGILPRDIQVVTPQQEGDLGAKQLNLDIQERINPDAPEVKRGLKRFRLGDRVMQTTNSSDKNIYNGETGWISDVDVEGQSVEVSFHDGKKIRYDKGSLKELSLAYATTVHKLQGSETDYMIMVLANTHRPLLYRNLLYTGVSRARRLCVLLGESKAIRRAIDNDSPSVRNSRFKERLLLN